LASFAPKKERKKKEKGDAPEHAYHWPLGEKKKARGPSFNPHPRKKKRGPVVLTAKADQREKKKKRSRWLWPKIGRGKKEKKKKKGEGPRAPRSDGQ